MILSKSRKFIFLRVPKTASTSLQRQILESIPYEEIDLHTQIDTYDTSGVDKIPEDSHLHKCKYPHEHIPSVFSAINAHPNLADLIKHKVLSYDELFEYKVYGVMREPIDRLVSQAQQSFSLIEYDPPLTNALALSSFFHVLDNKAVDEQTGLMLHHRNPGLFNSQIHWLRYNGRRINRLFKYDEISKLLEEITGETELKYNHRSHYRKVKEVHIPDELAKEVRRRYPEDFALWESLSSNSFSHKDHLSFLKERSVSY